MNISILNYQQYQIEKFSFAPFELNKYADIVFHKDKEMLGAYKWLFSSHQEPKSVFEIGIKQGGSLVLWKELFPSAKVAGLDIDLNQIQPSAREYFSQKGIEAFNGTGMNQVTLNKIVDGTFGGKVDLIIDDGGHTMETIRTAFKTLWEKLSPEGLYVIEDWSSLHQIHRMEFLGELIEFLIGAWEQKATGSNCPYSIHLFRNFIAINKK